MKAVYQDVKVVLLDEVSLIGHKWWTAIDERLHYLKINKSPFGNLHVVAIGDFFQLPPVNDKYLFDIVEDPI